MGATLSPSDFLMFGGKDGILTIASGRGGQVLGLAAAFDLAAPDAGPGPRDGKIAVRRNDSMVRIGKLRNE